MRVARDACARAAVEQRARTLLAGSFPRRPSTDAAVSCTSVPLSTSGARIVGPLLHVGVALRMGEDDAEPADAQPKQTFGEVERPADVRRLDEENREPPSPKRASSSVGRSSSARSSSPPRDDARPADRRRAGRRARPPSAPVTSGSRARARAASPRAPRCRPPRPPCRSRATSSRSAAPSSRPGRTCEWRSITAVQVPGTGSGTWYLELERCALLVRQRRDFPVCSSRATSTACASAATSPSRVRTALARVDARGADAGRVRSARRRRRPRA